MTLEQYDRATEVLNAIAAHYEQWHKFCMADSITDLDHNPIDRAEAIRRMQPKVQTEIDRLTQEFSEI